MRKLYNIINREVLIEKMRNSAEERITISFYKYCKILNPYFFRNYLFEKLDDLGTLGRIYVAQEGINAQFSIPKLNLAKFKTTLDEIEFLKDIRLNYAIEDDGKSFFKLNIKCRNKIVADGIEDPEFDVTQCGTHVDASTFNELCNQKETLIVDMRNHYESEVGHFEHAVMPDVVTFRESLPLIAADLQEHKDKNILLYCTGGIRCEKASAYMKYKGYKNVFQLNGGIIEYARQVKSQNLENKFLGKNFVFDERLGERITDSIISHCHQCGAVSDHHVNCKNDQCHILFIQCDDCADKYEACCSKRCADFIKLDITKQEELKSNIEFNGSKFSKGRYKALGQDEALNLGE